MLYESRTRRLPIPYALLREVSQQNEAAPNGDPAVTLGQAILSVFPGLEGDLEVCIHDLAEFLNEQADKIQEQATEQASGKRGSLLGKSTRDWILSMDSDAVCVFLADWDYDRAQHLYWCVDHRDVMRMFEIRAEYEETRISIAFEGALYGFGGELKGGAGSNTSVHDLTENSEAASRGWQELGNLFCRKQ